MGVPKFFRWLSERYPLINQRFHSPSPLLEEQQKAEENKKRKRKTKESGGSSDDDDEESTRKTSSATDITSKLLRVDFSKDPCQKDALKSATLPPQIDRLYIDMNGIIHGCSHANNEDDGSVTDITHAQILENVTYYLDRVIGTMVQPTELVYMAVDGVAPRAKLNQQRSRRYRSGTAGHELEMSIYEAHQQRMDQEQQELLMLGKEQQATASSSRWQQQEIQDEFLTAAADNELMTKASSNRRLGERAASATRSSGGGVLLTEVEPGRYSGKIETHLDDPSSTSGDKDEQESLFASYHNTTTATATAAATDETTTIHNKFHSNNITPGTVFFQEFSQHLEAFIQDKLAKDPKWSHLTIILSGPNVPGEGEHKIMDFIRAQRLRDDYNPNLRHCIQGQDGDLMMLGLVTHEPNLVLLRELVIFDAQRRDHIAGMGVDAYVHNPNFGSFLLF